MPETSTASTLCDFRIIEGAAQLCSPSGDILITVLISAIALSCTSIMVKYSHEPKWAHTSDSNPLSLIDGMAIFVISYTSCFSIYHCFPFVFGAAVIVLNESLSLSLIHISEPTRLGMI